MTNAPNDVVPEASRTRPALRGGRFRIKRDVPDVRRHAPPRILLAEDDHEMRRFLALVLRREGYEVVEAQTGAELLEVLADQLVRPAMRPPLDLVISDLRMPFLTGMSILRWLKSAAWATPFILMTAFGSEAVRQRAIEFGAAAVFDKPFDVSALRGCVHELVGDAEA